MVASVGFGAQPFKCDGLSFLQVVSTSQLCDASDSLSCLVNTINVTSSFVKDSNTDQIIY